MGIRRSGIWFVTLAVLISSVAGGVVLASLHLGRTAAKPPLAAPPSAHSSQEPPAAPPGGEGSTGGSVPGAAAGGQTLAPLPRGEGKLAIIIDDMGQGLPGTAQLLQIHRPLTFSFLPHSPFLQKEVREVEAEGQQVFLHLPMEPMPSSFGGPVPDAITVDMTDEQIAARVRELAATVPDARAVNNHMGSLATADPRVMTDVITTLKALSLPFIDSRTQSRSVGYETARRLGLPTAENSLFIDRDRTVPAIEARLRQAALLAQKHGSVIVIAHPHPDVAEALTAMLPLLDEAGVRLVYASQLLK